MQPKLSIVINEVMEVLKNRELSKATLTTYRERYFHLIEVFFMEHGTDLYSDTMLHSCLQHYRSKMDSGNIGKRHFLQMERCIRYLEEYHHNHSIMFQRNGSCKKYIPSEEHIQLTELIIKNSNYNSGISRRIHICMREFFCYL